MIATTTNKIEIIAVREFATFVPATTAARVESSTGTGVIANVLATMEANAATTSNSVR